MCDYISTRTNDLKRHKEIKHIGIRYQCDKCELSASTPANLKVHIESKHENIIYPCDQCDYIATLPGSLKVHIGRKHDIKRYASTYFLENEQMHVKFDWEGKQIKDYVIENIREIFRVTYKMKDMEKPTQIRMFNPNLFLKNHTTRILNLLYKL